MNAERIEALKEKIRTGQILIHGDYQDVSDLLVLLDEAELYCDAKHCLRRPIIAKPPTEKAEQIKAGEDKAVKLTGGLTTAPVAETSPGSFEDERALRVMAVKIVAVLPRPLETMDEQQGFIADVVSILRSRLAAGAPKAAMKARQCSSCIGTGRVNLNPCTECGGTGIKVAPSAKTPMMEILKHPDGWWLNITNPSGKQAMFNLGSIHRPAGIINAVLEEALSYQSCPAPPDQKRRKELMKFLGDLTHSKRLDGSWTDEEFDCYLDITRLVLKEKP